MKKCINTGTPIKMPVEKIRDKDGNIISESMKVGCRTLRPIKIETKKD